MLRSLLNPALTTNKPPIERNAATNVKMKFLNASAPFVSLRSSTGDFLRLRCPARDAVSDNVSPQLAGGHLTGEFGHQFFGFLRERAIAILLTRARQVNRLQVNR